MLKKSYCLLFVLALANASVTLADERFEPFSAERFQALQSEGREILVEVYADWCSTCRRQGPILEELLGEAQFGKLAALKLDWDAQRPEAQELGAPRQSTLILFSGSRRVGTSVAETDPQRLREFLGQIQTSPGG